MTYNGATITCSNHANDNIALQLVSKNDITGMEYRSESVTMGVDIININEPTTITLRYNTTSSGYLRGSSSIQQQTEVSTTRIQRSINAYSGGSSQVLEANVNMLVFTQDVWQIDDPDCDAAPVRVRINTSSPQSFISITKPALEVLDFNSAKYCFQREVQLNCLGDGQDDNDMIFVVAPSQLRSVLQSLQYYSFKPLSADTITITVYDGKGSNCFPGNALETISVYGECFATSFHVDVRWLVLFLSQAQPKTSVY